MSADPFLIPARDPMAGPRWRAAVVRSASRRTRPLADEAVRQLRTAGCMAVEIDTTGTDPFVDIDSQWNSAIQADAYDVVLSIDRLLPTAVAIAALAGIPVATITSVPTTSLPALIEAAVAAGAVRTLSALEVVAGTARRMTMNGIEIHADTELTAQLGHGHQARPLLDTAWSISPVSGATGDLLVTAHRTNAVTQVDQLHLQAPGPMLRIDIDGRSQRATSLTVTGVPHGLRLLDLDPTHNRQPLRPSSS